MVTAKTRKVGNSVAVFIPKQLNVELDTEYLIYKSQNGSLIFTPKIDNLFSSDEVFENDYLHDSQESAAGEFNNEV